MLVPVEWLNSYFEKPLSARQLAEALERAGVEVEGIEGAPDLDEKIIVGRVLEVTPHPNADRLRVAKLDLGSNQPTIVCGAPNLEAGQLVAVAQVGAKLPDGTELKAAPLRGVTSEGMICSAKELGLGDDHSGIMVLDANATVGLPVRSLLGGGDVIDTTTAANRWDLNGLIWLAREAAAHSDSKLKLTDAELPQTTDTGATLEVEVEAAELVPRYMLAHLQVDASVASPDWLKQRLQQAGIRPISLVVDITNYVMIEYGQPLHAFDAAKVSAPISVRLAQGGERLVTLDGADRQLDPADLVNADSRGPIGLAGVMGGQNTEISSDTTAIYLEAASFEGASVRRTARRQGLRSDASGRFERRIPVQTAALGLARAIQLLQEHAGAQLIGGVADELQVKVRDSSVLGVQVQRIGGLLGLELSADRIQTELAKLNLGSKPGTQPDQLQITVPWWRPDLRDGADIAEEVIKLVGYDKLPSTLPTWKPDKISFDSIWQPRWQAKAALRSLGLFEVMSYSFISEAQINTLGRNPEKFLELDNPLSQEQAYLRTDLLPSLLRVAERNRSYAKQFGMFELSKVYLPQDKGQLPKEPLRLGVLIRSTSLGYRSVKAVLDRLGRTANVDLRVEPVGAKAAEPQLIYPERAAWIKVGGETIGWIGQLHPALATQTKLGGELGYLELDWEQFSAASRPVRYHQPSRFPAVSRDLSILVKRDITWQKVKDALPDVDLAFLSDYYGPDLGLEQKGMALRLTFRESDRTLTDAEADTRAGAVFEKLQRAVSAQIRT
jgi:phenylalanyl-tRNA synthetase beta chain